MESVAEKGRLVESVKSLEFLVRCQVANPEESVAKFQCNISRTISRLKVQRTENSSLAFSSTSSHKQGKINFKTISSESICSTFLIIAISAVQKHYFQSFLIYFGPMMQRFVFPCLKINPKNPNGGKREWLFENRLS